ncbi:MAG: hypothetical protein L0I24_11730 [Pseudonocardia sp.]|nr:hypothetical protein [Pseudonocardia sp.]
MGRAPHADFAADPALATNSVVLLQGNPSQIPFSPGALVPDIQINSLAFLGGILLFTGMEMAGFHARDTRPPAAWCRGRSSWPWRRRASRPAGSGGSTATTSRCRC